jgi:predicted Rossmann fold flavoprotein
MEAVQVNYDVIIVGAGASGLVAAIAAARQGSSVLVIEKNEKAGKKILATGNGKCNYTNLVQNPDCYRSDDSAFVMKVLSCFDVTKTILFFEELGIYPKERNGYLYPNSEQAASVVQVLMMECERLNVQFAFEEEVIQIKGPNFTIITQHKIKSKENNKNKNNKEKKVEPIGKRHNLSKSVTALESVRSDYNKYHCNRLILATGGCASPQLGSDGSGYSMVQIFGHSIIKPLPALVQLKSPQKYCKTISGVRVIGKVIVYADVNVIAEEEGELLFTDYGISGIPILQISRFVAKALDIRKKVQLKIDYLPGMPKEEVKAMLKKRSLLHPDKTLEEMMIGLFHNKLSYIMIMEAGLDPYKVCNRVTDQELETLTYQIKQFTMDISDTNSFDNAQVCAGGVPTKELQESTLESKLMPDLFLVGELVDVDGTCGGYNLQWAWSSGYLAGSEAGSRR